MVSGYDIVLFDLDGTLIDEREYLDGIYSQIAVDVHENYGHNVYDVYKFLTDMFTQEGRKRLFNKTCEKFHLPQEEVTFMLHRLRTTKVELNVFPAMIPVLAQAKRIAICTDGNPSQQRNKMRCAGLRYKVYHTHKPATGGLVFPNSVMIGNSELDRKFAENLGADYIDSSFYLV